MTGWSDRRKMAAMACILIVAPSVVAVSVGYQTRRLYPHEEAAPPAEGRKTLPERAVPAELAEFQTHLPIVVLEFEREPKIHSRWDRDRGYAVQIREDRYVDGTLALYHKEGEPNRLTDAPALATRIMSRLRGFSSMFFPKHQYLIRMVNEDGSRNEVDVLGMGAEWEWIINISYIDKSLVRNYLALNIASRIMGYAPEIRYCEAFRKRGEEYEYLGVYLFMESIRRGKDRVNITKYNPTHAETAYMLRRDRYDARAIILDTYGSIQGLAKGSLGVRYPGKSRLTDKSIDFIEEEITRFEKALYAENVAEFVTYRDLIDIDSFVDYYLINEYFCNYDAAYNSFYMHKDLNQRLRLGPVWDFDQAVDNNQPFIFEPDAAAMQVGVWFDRLTRDAFFSRRLRSRYRELRRGYLSDAYIERFIDNVVAYLGDARARDWNRWRYNDPNTLEKDKVDRVHPSLASNMRDFEEEIAHIKSILRRHAAWLDAHLGDVVMGNVVTID